jgi:hypothetical protein
MKLVFTPEAKEQADECDTWRRENRDARDLFARELASGFRGRAIRAWTGDRLP